MAIYREGKAAMAADGTVTGTGTKWQSSLSLIRPGATIMFLSSPIQIAVVNKVVSDTEIKAITTKGAVVASTDYAILLSDSLTVDGLAQDVAETLRYYQSQESTLSEVLEFFEHYDFDSLKVIADQIKADAESSEINASAAASSASAAADSEAAAKASENAAKASETEAKAAMNQTQQIINNAGEQSTLVALAQPTGASGIGTSSGITVQAALGALINKDRVIMLSNYYARGLRGENAFLAAYNDSFVNGYNSKIIVNDTKDWVPITRQYVFQSSVESAYHYFNYNANIAGVVGHYQMKGVAQFKFIKCYDPFVSIHILGDKTDAGAFPDNREASSFAVRFEEDVIGPTFIVNGRNYNGWLVGSLGRTVVIDGVTQKVGVQSINASSQVVAYNCGGSVCFAGTNGLGFINSIVEGNCTAGAFFLDCHDINIENFQPGKFKFQKCTSVVITKKLMGPSKNYIYGCTGFHTVSALFIASQTDPAMSKQTEDVYSVEVVDSILHYSRVRGYGPNCLFKLGNYADVTIDNAEGVAINQFARLSSDVGSYTGLNGVSTVSVRLIVHDVAVTTGNTALGFSSKACFAIDDGIPAALTIKDGQIIWNTDYQTSPTYAVYGGNNSGSRITVDNINFGGTYTGSPVYIPHQDAIGKLYTPGSEVNVAGTLTTGNGRRLRIGWGMTTTDAVWNTRCPKQVYFVAQLNDATNSSFIVTVDGKPAAYYGKMTGQVSGNFTVSKGQTSKYSMNLASLLDTYAELITG